MISKITQLIVMPFLILKKLLNGPGVNARMARGAFWSLVSNIATKFITMTGAVYIARMLGPKGNGEFSVVMSTLGLFGMFAGLGLGTVCTKHIAEFKNKNPGKASKIFFLSLFIALGTGLFFTLVCILFNEQFSILFLSSTTLSHYLLPASFLIITGTLTGIFQASLDGFESFKSKTNIGIASGIFTVGLSVILVWKFNVLGAIFGLVISSTIFLPIYFLAIKRQLNKHNMKIILDKSILSESSTMWSFGLPSFVSGVLVVFISWFMIRVLVSQENGMHDTGIFGVANQWRLSLTTIVITLNSALLPILSDLQGNQDSKPFENALALNIKAALIIALPATVFWIVIARPFTLLYGDKYEGVDLVFVTLLIPFFLNAIGIPLGMSIVSKGKMRVFTLLNLLWASIATISALLLCPTYGALGLSLSYLISHFIHTFVKMVYIDRNISKHAIRSNSKLLIYSYLILGMTVVAWLFNQYTIIISCTMLLLSLIPLIRETKIYIAKNKNVGYKEA